MAIPKVFFEETSDLPSFCCQSADHSDCGFVVTSALVQSHNYFHVSLPFRCKLLSKGAINCAGWRCFLPSRLPQMEDKVNISQYDIGSCCKKNDELLAKDHPIGHFWLASYGLNIYTVKKPLEQPCPVEDDLTYKGQPHTLLYIF